MRSKSCADTCKTHGETCDAAKAKTINTYGKMQSLVAEMGMQCVTKSVWNPNFGSSNWNPSDWDNKFQTHTTEGYGVGPEIMPVTTPKGKQMRCIQHNASKADVFITHNNGNSGAMKSFAYSCTEPSIGYQQICACKKPPTPNPTPNPSPNPTANPSPKPTANPSPNPTANPSPKPTSKPTAKPTAKPSVKPVPAPVVKADECVGLAKKACRLNPECGNRPGGCAHKASTEMCNTYKTAQSCADAFCVVKMKNGKFQKCKPMKNGNGLPDSVSESSESDDVDGGKPVVSPVVAPTAPACLGPKFLGKPFWEAPVGDVTPHAKIKEQIAACQKKHDFCTCGANSCNQVGLTGCF